MSIILVIDIYTRLLFLGPFLTCVQCDTRLKVQDLHCLLSMAMLCMSWSTLSTFNGNAVYELVNTVYFQWQCSV